MGGESTSAWPTVVDELVKRGLQRPELLIVDGGTGLESAITAVWDSVPVHRCTGHKHPNLREANAISAETNGIVEPGVGFSCVREFAGR